MADARVYTDTEMLDWWIAHPTAVLVHNEHGKVAMYMNQSSHHGFYDDARSAIDAAMQAPTLEHPRRCRRSTGIR